MSKAEYISKTMAQLLDQAQKTFAVHGRCIRTMAKLYKLDSKEFRDVYIKVHSAKYCFKIRI